jgi:hypothetical protein
MGDVLWGFHVVWTEKAWDGRGLCGALSQDGSEVGAGPGEPEESPPSLSPHWRWSHRGDPVSYGAGSAHPADASCL